MVQRIYELTVQDRLDGSLDKNKMLCDEATDQMNRPSLCVLLITLNEEVHLEQCLSGVLGWANQVIVVDSGSTDKTLAICRSLGVTVISHPFNNFGEQWNFTVSLKEIETDWCMKLDPDERLTAELKTSIDSYLIGNHCDALVVTRRLWFLGKPLSVKNKTLRVWRTGYARFTEDVVNEQVVVRGIVQSTSGLLEHLDSQTIEHWMQKHNKYSTLEVTRFKNNKELPEHVDPSARFRLRLKRIFYRLPFRYLFLRFYLYIWLGALFSGPQGRVWAELKMFYYRLVEIKLNESLLEQVDRK